MSNPYPQQIIFTNGVISYADVTDEWVLASKPRYLLITSDKATIGHADPPTDLATITIQLQTPLLTNNTRSNVVATIVDVPILCDESRRLVTLTDGIGTFTVGSIVAGTLTIHADRANTLDSNTITIEVI